MKKGCGGKRYEKVKNELEETHERRQSALMNKNPGGFRFKVPKFKF